MSAVIAEELALHPADLTHHATEPRFALARNAIEGSKAHAEESLIAYFNALLGVFEHFYVKASYGGIFDTKVFAAVDRSKLFIAQYQSMMQLVATSEEPEKFTPALGQFLESVLNYKKSPDFSTGQPYMWRDSFRFLSREIFLSTVATLLRHRQWSTVVTLLEAAFEVRSVGALSFVAFDGFPRSIDVFHNGRLKLQRVSVSSDVLKERTNTVDLSFEDIMQADFILHLYSLMNSRTPVESPAHSSSLSSMKIWYARTLSYAHKNYSSGFNLFIQARGGEDEGFLKALFGAGNWTILKDDVRAVATARTKLIGVDADIDYVGLLAGRSSIFA